MAFDPDAELEALRAEAAAKANAAPALVDFDFDPDSELDELRAEALQREHGGLTSQLAAGAEGLARSLTLGGSTYIEKALGVDPKGIEARAKANPKASVVGETIGIIAPLLATAGASAPASGVAAAAKATAPAIVGRAGTAIAKGVTKALPKATGALGKAAVKGAAEVAQGLAEGALFGAGQVVHESALGDPNLTAQRALEEIGLSALFGGALSGGVGVLGSLAGSATKGLGAKLGTWLEEFEGMRNLKAAGAVQSDLKSAAKRMSREELNKIGREAGELGLVGPFSTPAKTLERADDLMASAGKRMGDILDAADNSGFAPKAMEHVVGRARKEILEALQKNPLERATAANLAGTLDEYTKLFSPDAPPLTFRALHNIRKDVSDKLYGLRGVADPDANALKQSLHKFRTIISQEIEDGLKASGLGTKAWKEASREYQVAAQISKFAEAGADRAAGNNPLGLLSVILGATGLATHGIPGGTGMAIGTEFLKRYGSGIAGSAARAIRTAGPIETLAKSNQEVATRIADLSRAVVKGGVAIAAPRLAHAEIENRAIEVQRFAQDVGAATEALAAASDDVSEHAPNVAMAFQAAAARGAALLNSMVPAVPIPGPLAPKLSMSEEQKWKFGRYYTAITKPTSILSLAASGQLTPLDVDAVKTTYPELYSSMQESVLDEITKHQGTIPYQRRLMLSMILGQSVDGTSSQIAMAANQAIYARPSERSGLDMTGPSALGKTTQSGLAKVKIGSRAMTSGQSAEEREALG